MTKDNKGFSLVELLVALAVSSIVLTALGYMIITGLKLYGRNNAHVEVQSEAQTAMNLILDNIMEARGICIVNPATGDNTDCILLGDIIVEDNMGNYDVYFAGNAIIADLDSLGGNGQPIKEMYLVSFPNTDYSDSTEHSGYAKLVSGFSPGEGKMGEAVNQARIEVRDYVKNTDIKSRTKWLLAHYITGCRIEADGIDRNYYEETVYYENGGAEVNYYYKEPVKIDVKISLEYDYGSGKITKALSDSAVIRNRIDNVYVGQNGSANEYKRKK